MIIEGNIQKLKLSDVFKGCAEGLEKGRDLDGFMLDMGYFSGEQLVGGETICVACLASVSIFSMLGVPTDLWNENLNVAYKRRDLYDAYLIKGETLKELELAIDRMRSCRLTELIKVIGAEQQYRAYSNEFRSRVSTALGYTPGVTDKKFTDSEDARYLITNKFLRSDGGLSKVIELFKTEAKYVEAHYE